MIISNSCPLIYLTKINKLDLLKILFKEISIPKEVYEEVVVKGLEGNFLDALKVKNSIKENWIKVENIKITKEMSEFISEIDIGEISVINLARNIKPKLLLIDDASARAIAESFGFEVKGTLYILLKAYKHKLMTKDEIKLSLKDLVSNGFRISSELYVQILDSIEK